MLLAASCISPWRSLHQDLSKDYYWPLDQHFNQRGYDVYGDCVTEALIEIMKEDPNFFETKSIPK